MEHYKVVLLPSAQKQLDKLEDNIAFPIIIVLQQLAINPRPPGYTKLKGRDGFRVRKGDYRIIYDIFDDLLLINIIKIGHRREVYD